MAAPSMAASVCVWFRLEGAASADFLEVSLNNNVAQLRKAIYAELKAKLEPRGVIASELVLSTADRETYDDEEARVPTVHQTKKDALIVTGTFVRAARLSVRGGLWSSQLPRPHVKPLRPELVRPLWLCAELCSSPCSCALRVYVALCCVVGSRGPARVDSFVSAAFL
jgi:hypothetical protein